MKRLVRSSISIMFLGLVVACGSGSDGDSPDAGVICGNPHDGGTPSAETATAWAVGTDYTAAGTLSNVDLMSMQVSADAVAGAASTDPVLRHFGDKLYIVNRLGFDNVTIVDPSSGQVIDQISTGNGTNPQDVAVKGDKIYVAAFDSGNVLVLDAANPEAEPATIDISGYDGDGLPNATSLYLVGDDLFVTLPLLDESFVSHGGKVVVIDTTTDTVSTDFDLTYQNPAGFLQPHGDDLIVATTEDFGAGPGCLELIETTPPYGASCLVENSALGGYGNGYASDGSTVWVAVATSFTESKLVTVSSAGAVSTAFSLPCEQPTDLAICPGGHVVVGDATGAGLRVFAADGTELTGDVLDIGQPPAFVNAIVCL